MDERGEKLKLKDSESAPSSAVRGPKSEVHGLNVNLAAVSVSESESESTINAESESAHAHTHTYARTNTFSCATRTWCDMLRLSGPLKRIPNTKLNKLMCLGDSELKNVAERVCNDYSKLRNVATAEVVKTDS